MSIGSVLRNSLRRTPTGIRGAAAYWEKRHRDLRGSIRAVGHIGLDEDANQRQYKTKQSHVLAMIQRYIPAPAGRRLLDAGCGIGAMTVLFTEMGFDVVGADISQTAIAEARRRVPGAEFVLGSLTSLQLLGTFDVVVVTDVLMHTVRESDFGRTVRSLGSWLAADGVMIVLDYLHTSGPAAGHVRFRPRERFDTAFAAVNLTVVEHQHVTLNPEGVIKDLLAVRHSQDTDGVCQL